MIILSGFLMPFQIVAKTVRVVVKRDTLNQDPYKGSKFYESIIQQLLHRTLVKTDKDGKIISDLAKKWFVSDSGKTYTFILKENTSFSDGSSFSSKDVKHSLSKYILTYKNSSSYHLLKYLLIGEGSFNGGQLIKVLELINKNTIKIHLKEPYSPFLKYLTSVVITNDKGAGLGDYFVSISRKGYIKLTANSSSKLAPETVELYYNEDYDLFSGELPRTKPDVYFSTKYQFTKIEKDYLSRNGYYIATLPSVVGVYLVPKGNLWNQYGRNFRITLGRSLMGLLKRCDYSNNFYNFSNSLIPEGILKTPKHPILFERTQIQRSDVWQEHKNKIFEILIPKEIFPQSILNCLQEIEDLTNQKVKLKKASFIDYFNYKNIKEYDLRLHIYMATFNDVDSYIDPFSEIHDSFQLLFKETRILSGFSRFDRLQKYIPYITKIHNEFYIFPLLNLKLPYISRSKLNNTRFQFQQNPILWEL